MYTNVIHLRQYKMKKRIDHLKKVILSPDVLFFAIFTFAAMLIAFGCYELSTSETMKKVNEMYIYPQSQGYFIYNGM
jgi:hypothetical protein